MKAEIYDVRCLLCSWTLLVLKRLATGYDIKCLRVAAPLCRLDDFDYGLRKALDPQFDWETFGKL